MGFWRNLDRSIDQFLEFRPDAYRAEVAGLREESLRELHKRIQRKLVGAGTQTAIGIAAAIPTGGVSLIGSIVGGRRINVNQQRCNVIEALLKERGWSGHDFQMKDFIIGAAPGAIAVTLAPGADHAVDQLISHATTTPAHHGADQVANYASTALVPPGEHSAAAALGISAAHHGAEAAMKIGTNYVLNELSSTATARKASSSQKLPAPQTTRKYGITSPSTPLPTLKHRVTKPSTTGSSKYKESPSNKYTTASAPKTGGFIQTVARMALILLPSIICSTLDQETMWIACALLFITAALSSARTTFLILLIAPSITTYFVGMQVLWQISTASAIVDVLDQNSLDWHRTLLRLMKVVVYAMITIFIGVFAGYLIGAILPVIT
ncbi:hypothetical protein GP486_002204 [Trichoglossum hirsutum]|uniref:Uncharacterized protein n=1 Tax=Trichoglossum hirsutum TaxID=265104 RepID=A0A9P8LEQ6_9PEZI|nr:hypothetical protein GP486_002204 [Trichoglossum hirsutum]